MSYTVLMTILLGVVSIILVAALTYFRIMRKNTSTLVAVLVSTLEVFLALTVVYQTVNIVSVLWGAYSLGMSLTPYLAILGFIVLIASVSGVAYHLSMKSLEGSLEHWIHLGLFVTAVSLLCYNLWVTNSLISLNALAVILSGCVLSITNSFNQVIKLLGVVTTSEEDTHESISTLEKSEDMVNRSVNEESESVSNVSESVSNVSESEEITTVEESNDVK